MLNVYIYLYEVNISWCVSPPTHIYTHTCRERERERNGVVYLLKCCNLAGCSWVRISDVFSRFFGGEREAEDAHVGQKQILRLKLGSQKLLWASESKRGRRSTEFLPGAASHSGNPTTAWLISTENLSEQDPDGGRWKHTRTERKRERMQSFTDACMKWKACTTLTTKGGKWPVSPGWSLCWDKSLRE